MGCGKKNLLLIWRCHQLHSGFLTKERPLAPNVTPVTSVGWICESQFSRSFLYLYFHLFMILPEKWKLVLLLIYIIWYWFSLESLLPDSIFNHPGILANLCTCCCTSWIKFLYLLLLNLSKWIFSRVLLSSFVAPIYLLVAPYCQS